MKIAEWCNGSTADSDSVCEGSNPSSAANFSIGEVKIHGTVVAFIAWIICGIMIFSLRE